MSESQAPGIDALVASLTLQPTTPEVYDEAYLGTTQPCPWPKAYGGDMVAQAAAAAMLSMTDADRVLHSMHSYFMRPVDIGGEVRYEVENLRDGRGYSTRQVRAFSGGKVVYVALASFHVPEASGPGFAPAADAGVTLDPETLRTSAEVLADVEVGSAEAGMMSEAAKLYWSQGRSFDMRHAEGPVYVQVEGRRVPAQGVWVRAYRALPDAIGGLSPDQTHTAALAYVCDYTIIEPILRVLGLAWSEDGLVTASLDHAMWFHRAARVDDWLLYAQEAVTAQDGRGLGLGRFFTRSGDLVATVVQEASIRPKR